MGQTPRKTIPMELGDSIVVCGQTFVLTEVWCELGKPSSLTTKQPIELLEELD